jgi:hypothetical protein
MSKTLKLRLTIDVTYELNGETPKTMTDLLNNVAENAYDMGYFTTVTDAEVESFTSSVKPVTD